MIQRIFIFHVVVAYNVKTVGKCLRIFLPTGVIFSAIGILQGTCFHLHSAQSHFPPHFAAEAFPSSFCKEPFSSAASPMIFFIFSSVNSSSRPHQKEQIPLDTGRLGSSPLTVSASLVATVYPLFSPPRSVISFPVDQIITEGCYGLF